MKLPTYNSLKQKEEIFGSRYERIDSWTSFDKLIHQLGCVKSYLYRGMSEAKYKNFTSLQRFYLIHEFDKTELTIGQIAQKQVEYLLEQNEGLLKRYFEYIGIKPNWFLLNSFLQHYGGKTPLLDFSRDLYVALFFMQDSCYVSPDGNEDIDNYCSLYFIIEDEMDCVNTMIENATENFVQGYEGINRKLNVIDESLKNNYAKSYKLTKDAVDNIPQKAKEFIDSLFTEQFYNSFEKLAQGFNMDDFAFFLDENVLSLESDTLNIHDRIVTTTNLNSVAQKGAFIMTFGTKPLENNDLHCVDIHKSLIPTIRKYIEGKNKTRETLFPQEEILAKKALESCLIFGQKLNDKEPTENELTLKPINL